VGVYICLLLVVFLWGSSNVAVKAALSEFNPAALVFWRHLTGAVVLLAVLCATRRFTWLKAREWPAVFALSFFGVFLYQMLQTTGLVLTTATNSGWLGLLAPVFIALFSFAFLGEQPTWAKVAGITLAFGGALGLTLGDLTSLRWSSESLLGDGLVLLAAVSWAAFSVLTRGLAINRPPLVVTTYTFLAGVLLLTPVAPWPTSLQLTGLSLRAWSILAYLAVGCSAVAYLLWYRILGRMEASRAGAWLYLTPVVTTLTAALIGEKLMPSSLGYGAVILSGVWLVNWSK